MRDEAGGDWPTVFAAFDAVMDAAPGDRNAAVARYPEALRADLNELLAADAASGVLDRALATAATEAPAELLAPGTVVGRFTVDRLIGRGGMGEVYSARRDDLDQHVALKLLRPGPEVRAGMFDRERRMLAGLEHPGIARLIDGGVTGDGRLWMAMEYVEGEPIDGWCRARATPLRDRLRLFAEVCDAVAYAHAALVVHCDLKPSNILVDASGRVRLLDFGVARLVDDPEVAAAAATPDYAAPEQLVHAPPTVAVDVYALGAVLFELLTGHSPWQTGGSAPSLIKRLLRDEPPLASEAAAAGAPVPAARLAGDLDAICAKALRNDPKARYGTVAALAADVRRVLDYRPVQARGGGAAYVLGRFARRSPWAVGASIAAVLAVIAGTGGVALQARRTAVERDVALAEAARSDAINRMVTLVFRDARDQGGSGDATVKQTLDAAADRLVKAVVAGSQRPTVVIAVADLYIHLEDPVGADTLLTKALAAGVGRGNPIVTAELQMRLGNVKGTMNKLDEGRALFDAAERAFGTDPRFRGERLEIIAGRAQILHNSGDRDGAVDMLAASLPEVEAVYATDHRELLTRYNNLIVYLGDANRLDAIPPMIARTEAAERRMGETESVFGLSTLQLKGAYLYKRGDLRGADRVFTRVVALRRSRFGKSAGLAADLMQSGRTKLALDEPAAALPLLAEAQPLAVATLGPTATPTLVIGLGLAEAKARTGDPAGADTLLQAVAPAFTGPEFPAPLKGMFLRTEAVVRDAQGRRAEAVAALDRAQSIFVAAGSAGALGLKGVAKTRAALRH